MKRGADSMPAGQSSSRVRLLMRLALVAAMSCAMQAFAQQWVVEPIETRADQDGKPVRVTTALHTPPQGTPRHVVVYSQPGAAPAFKDSTPRTTTTFTGGGPWVRGAVQLAQRGIAVLYLDVPSDAAGRVLAVRPVSEVRRDLQAGIDHARKRFPDASVQLGSLATPPIVLEAAAGLRGASRVTMVSGVFNDARALRIADLSLPVLVVHAATAQCDVGAFFEAEHFAQRHRYSFVRAGYPKLEAAAGCGRDSQFALHGLEAPFAELVESWFDGQPVPASIGTASAPVAWQEQIVSYEAPGFVGSNRLEMTLLLPDAKGPVPVLLFNHGDVDIDGPAMRYKRRIRDMVVAREFLRLGVAVAMPARRGVAMSEGSYPTSFAASDGDATYKARLHAQDILPALDYLRSRPEFDAKRILIGGQSAGGYSAMYVASTSADGVVGAIDFSGGRTDMTSVSSAGYLNKMMVEGFRELGHTTRVPTLWIFAENDSRYSSNTIRASHEAFVAAGGKARLHLTPAIAGDGHHVHHKPEQWRGALREYLVEIAVIADAR